MFWLSNQIRNPGTRGPNGFARSPGVLQRDAGGPFPLIGRDVSGALPPRDDSPAAEERLVRASECSSPAFSRLCVAPTTAPTSLRSPPESPASHSSTQPCQMWRNRPAGLKDPGSAPGTVGIAGTSTNTSVARRSHDGERRQNAARETLQITPSTVNKACVRHLAAAAA